MVEGNCVDCFFFLVTKLMLPIFPIACIYLSFESIADDVGAGDLVLHFTFETRICQVCADRT